MLTKREEAAAIIASLTCHDGTKRGVAQNQPLFECSQSSQDIFLHIVSGASHNIEGGVQPQSAEGIVPRWALI